MLSPDDRKLLLEQHARMFRGVWHGEMTEPRLPELPQGAAYAVKQAHQHGFSVHAFHLFRNREPNTYVIMSPEVPHDDIDGDASIEHAAALLQSIHRPEYQVLDFLIEPALPGGERSLLIPEASRVFNPVFRKKRITPRRIPERELRIAETIAAKTGTNDEWIECHIARADGIVRAISDYFRGSAHAGESGISSQSRQSIGQNSDAAQNAIALVNLNHGCNPFFYQELDREKITYISFAPRYALPELQRPLRETHKIFVHALRGMDWFFALDYFRSIRTLLEEKAEEEHLADNPTPPGMPLSHPRRVSPASAESRESQTRGRYGRIDVHRLSYRTEHGTLDVILESTRRGDDKQSLFTIHVPHQSPLVRVIADYMASV